MELDLDSADWLWPEELKLMTWLILVHEPTFTWDITECRHLDEHYFPLVKIPTILHTPWVQHNIPILSMIHAQVINMIKDCTKSRMYEPSTSAYFSHWFYIVKKDRKSLHLMYPPNRCCPPGYSQQLLEICQALEILQSKGSDMDFPQDYYIYNRVPGVQMGLSPVD
ncbi:hypothetical protein M404DRAFT_28731 [Pisolithus tinctorius Marx 270]|uniref:Uncharacterized protein n=1 Tax=Pisolithus tinctorius Marx 270 TaxID=870435 RepID=A0A0C3P295_PISTI|nr:hypothetical protein M404DRAFT_28731 [Pisolithus tinctorius Marx 270]